MRLLKGWLNPKISNEVCPSSQNFSWKPVVDLNEDIEGPCQRNQHAVCKSFDSLYLYGGRGPHGCLNDLWKYNFETQTWSVLEVIATKDKPSSLEGHSLIFHDDCLYLFGGETSFASADEVPLWKLSLKALQWRKLDCDTAAPVGRREHIAVLHDKEIVVHGGYIDLKGPTDELWSFNIIDNSWKLLDSLNNVYPAARYKHSGVIYQDLLWICGGLMGVTDRNETQVWMWNLTSFFWTPIKIRGAPSQLFNHTSEVVGDEVLVFGGNQEKGHASSRLWRAKMSELLSKRFQTWKACEFSDKVLPSPSCGHCMVLVPCSTWVASPKTAHAFTDDFTNAFCKEKPSTTFHSIKHDMSISTEEVSKTLLLPKELTAKKSIHSSALDLVSPDKKAFSLAKDTDLLFHKVKDFIASDATIDLEGSGDVKYNSTENLLADQPKYFVSRRYRHKYNGYINKLYYLDSPKVSVLEDEMVKKFSYNLSNWYQPCQPLNRKNRKPVYQTTSFINLSSNKVSVIQHTDDLSANVVKFSKKNSDEKVMLHVAFHENSEKLLELENTLDAHEHKMSPKTSHHTLLVIGGSSTRTGNFRLKEPIHMWRCKFLGGD